MTTNLTIRLQMDNGDTWTIDIGIDENQRSVPLVINSPSVQNLSVVSDVQGDLRRSIRISGGYKGPESFAVNHPNEAVQSQ